MRYLPAMRPLHLALALLLTALFSTLLTLALTPRPTAAQPTPTTDVAIAQGPTGMWIVRGNQVTICVQTSPEIAGQPPPPPRCGTAARLP